MYLTNLYDIKMYDYGWKRINDPKTPLKSCLIYGPVFKQNVKAT